MNSPEPLITVNVRGLDGLKQHQLALLELVAARPADEISRQSHPDLSPLGWHLGHCVYTETYWLREVVLGEQVLEQALADLYVPELSIKYRRGDALPDPGELCNWAAKSQAENLALLAETLDRALPNRLMEDDYLVFFLCQHYAQHIETARYVLTQHRLEDNAAFEVGGVLRAADITNNYQTLPAGHYAIGADDPLRHYDNECRELSVELEDAAIASKPVSNAEYLGFMDDGGYTREAHWTLEGWRWLVENGVDCPQHWRRDAAGNFYGTNATGAFALNADDAASGLNHHEARAFARWAGAALPHEYQWEAACKLGLLSGTGQVWEWCENAFQPYPGFQAFPYDGYSIPWYDGKHFVLRGHSAYTLPVIQRASFRNFYQASKRHFPAGLRLVKK